MPDQCQTDCDSVRTVFRVSFHNPFSEVTYRAAIQIGVERARRTIRGIFTYTYIYIHACKRGVHLLLIRIRLRWREESREGYVRVTPALKSYTRSRVPACVVGVIYECYANTMKNAEVLINEESTMETIFARDQRTTSHRVLDATAESYEILPLQAKTQTYIKENFYKYNYDLPNSKCITSLPYSVAETARTKRNYSQRHLSRDSHLSDRRRWSYCTPRVTLTMLICK